MIAPSTALMRVNQQALWAVRHPNRPLTLHRLIGSKRINWPNDLCRTGTKTSTLQNRNADATFAKIPISNRSFELHIYNEHIARHYAAYRPPLHQLIVGEVLEDRRFGTGLDIGCGTGYSTIALATYCEQIIGIDQSQSMLDRATKHAKVKYRLGSGEDLPIEDRSIDLVTFAGVFSYLNAEKTISELSRVCRPDACILPYDFEVLIGELMDLFDLSADSDVSGYDHACNPSGMAGVSTLQSVSRTVDIQVSNQEAAHILLSDETRHAPLAEFYDTADPFGPVVEKLEATGWAGSLSAEIYYSLHQLTN